MSIWFIPDMLVTSDETDAKCGTLVGKAFDTSMFNKLREEGREDGATFKQLLSCIPGSESVSLDPSLLFGNLMKLGTETVALPNFHLTIGQAIGFAALSVIKGKKAAADAARSTTAVAAAVAAAPAPAATQSQEFPDATSTMKITDEKCNNLLNFTSNLIQYYIDESFINMGLFDGMSKCLGLDVQDATFGAAWQDAARTSIDKGQNLNSRQIATIAIDSIKNGKFTDMMGGYKLPRNKTKRSRKSKKLTRRRA